MSEMYTYVVNISIYVRKGDDNEEECSLSSLEYAGKINAR